MLESTNSKEIQRKEEKMSYFLTMIICSVLNGQTVCIPPIRLENEYVDSYTCLLDGYLKSYDKIVELGETSVNKYSIYVKFGCHENNSNKTTASYIVIK